MVTASNHDYPARPTILLLYDSSRQIVKSNRTIDLRDYKTVFIRRVLSESELNETLKGIGAL